MIYGGYIRVLGASVSPRSISPVFLGTFLLRTLSSQLAPKALSSFVGTQVTANLPISRAPMLVYLPGIPNFFYSHNPTTTSSAWKHCTPPASTSTVPGALPGFPQIHISTGQLPFCLVLFHFAYFTNPRCFCCSGLKVPFHVLGTPRRRNA